MDGGGGGVELMKMKYIIISKLPLLSYIFFLDSYNHEVNTKILFLCSLHGCSYLEKICRTVIARVGGKRDLPCEA